MASNSKFSWAKDLGLKVFVGLLSGVISSAIVTAAAFYYLREQIASTVSDGVKIMRIEDTATQLAQIRSCTTQAASIIDNAGADTADRLLADLRMSVARLQDVVQGSNSPQLLAERLAYGPGAGQANPKAEPSAVALARLQLHMADLAQKLAVAQSEIEEYVTFDSEAAVKQLDSAVAECNNAVRGLEARHSTLLETVTRFGRP